jgi:hypothetical protein
MSVESDQHGNGDASSADERYLQVNRARALAAELERLLTRRREIILRQEEAWSVRAGEAPAAAQGASASRRSRETVAQTLAALSVELRQIEAQQEELLASLAKVLPPGSNTLKESSPPSRTARAG